MADASLPGSSSGSTFESECLRISQLVQLQRASYFQDMNPSYESRIHNLNLLKSLIVDNQSLIHDALLADFSVTPFLASQLFNMLGPISRIKYTKSNLKSWMKPRSAQVDRLMLGFASAKIHSQPLGVIGIMGAWNFPFQLTLSPLIDALAAGNKAILKPSESAPHSAKVLHQLITQTFPPETVSVVVGNTLDTSKAFAAQKWDHLLYTGNAIVAREILKAAALNLVPVTLELGGKNPVIMTEDKIDLNTIRSILATKVINSGQFCLTADTIFVPKHCVDAFVQLAKQAYSQVLPPELNGRDQAGIINDFHFGRILNLFQEARDASVDVIDLSESREKCDPLRRTMPIHLVVDPDSDLLASTSEIFGPGLVVRGYSQVADAVDYINARDRPLALYVYTSDKKVRDYVLNHTMSGGATVNGIYLHVAVVDAPFGGVGASGMGCYHGKEGFQTMSHQRPVFYQFPWNAADTMNPPYKPMVSKMIAWLLQ
uniref:Aldehyde dehydrogenase n=1 Tax=Timspurckia oligopyrenoides TaxID=708627 RepID=A0A7S0ZIF1_9RHOD|mmetsp:Transcript_6544/g.11696  ORF Transcript_6544/g.11696 Transcript_6544/m.11696 type:complete len:487 (+) Transcript_6544:258-1718(+)